MKTNRQTDRQTDKDKKKDKHKQPGPALIASLVNHDNVPRRKDLQLHARTHDPLRTETEHRTDKRTSRVPQATERR